MDEQIMISLPEAAEPVQKSRGGLRDYSEAIADTVQRVRGQFLIDTFKPRVTFAYKSVTFNMACVSLFPDDQYVSLGIDETNLRLMVEPTVSYDKDNLKFALYKKGRNNPRTCVTKYFCPMLFEFMNWNPNAKYRCLAMYHDFGAHKVIAFNLDECQQVFSEVVETGDGKKKRNTTILMPENWKDRFGYRMDELDIRTRLDFTATLITIDNITGERKPSNIQPKFPTPEELMHQPYGGMRVKKEEADDDQ